MRIVIATPLYPPDIGGAAPYVKELATCLRKSHEVTIVAYGHLPEKIEGVGIVVVSKRRPLLIRLFLYTLTLLKAAMRADVLFAENGASVELPAAIATVLTRRPLIMHLGDMPAHEWAQRHHSRQNIEQTALRHAHTTLSESPPSKPEILPLEPRPEKALAAYEESWKAHVSKIEEIFHHAAKR